MPPGTCIQHYIVAMKKHRNLFFAISILAIASCNSDFRRAKPNVILIMTDDMGYECLSSYGSISYQTPNLDSLASEGILFSRCISQPLCTPSRVKIMTGLYNYRNYDYFGNLNIPLPDVTELRSSPKKDLALSSNVSSSSAGKLVIKS